MVFHSHPRDENGYLDRGGISITFKVDPSLLASGRFPDGLTVADLPDVRVDIDSVMDGKFPDDRTGGFAYSGPVDSFTAAPVPEPSLTIAALLLAAGWTVRRRR